VTDRKALEAELALVCRELERREQVVVDLARSIGERSFELASLDSAGMLRLGDTAGVQQVEERRRVLKAQVAGFMEKKQEADQDLKRARERKDLLEDELRGL
jgi:hypothetical protein